MEELRKQSCTPSLLCCCSPSLSLLHCNFWASLVSLYRRSVCLEKAVAAFPSSLAFMSMSRKLRTTKLARLLLATIGKKWLNCARSNATLRLWGGLLLLQPIQQGKRANAFEALLSSSSLSPKPPSASKFRALGECPAGLGLAMEQGKSNSPAARLNLTPRCSLTWVADPNSPTTMYSSSLFSKQQQPPLNHFL